MFPEIDYIEKHFQNFQANCLRIIRKKMTKSVGTELDFTAMIDTIIGRYV